MRQGGIQKKAYRLFSEFAEPTSSHENETNFTISGNPSLSLQSGVPTNATERDNPDAINYVDDTKVALTRKLHTST